MSAALDQQPPGAAAAGARRGGRLCAAGMECRRAASIEGEHHRRGAAHSHARKPGQRPISIAAGWQTGCQPPTAAHGEGRKRNARGEGSSAPASKLPVTRV